MNLDFLQKLKALSWASPRTIAMGVTVVCSVVLLWWSLDLRLSLIAEAQSEMHSLFHLDQEIASLRSGWPEADAAIVDQRIKQAEGRLLEGYDHLGRWLMKLTEEGGALGFNTEYRVEEKVSGLDKGGSGSQDLKGVQIVPVHLALQVPKIPVRSFEKYMRFLRGLGEDPLRVDIQEATISGAVHGAQTMDLRLHVFMREEG